MWLVKSSLSGWVLIFALFSLFSRWSQSNTHCLRMKAYSKLPWSVEQNAHFVLGLDNFVWPFNPTGNICDKYIFRVCRFWRFSVVKFGTCRKTYSSIVLKLKINTLIIRLSFPFSQNCMYGSYRARTTKFFQKGM